MKATFALLASPEVHNLVRKLSWDIHERFRTGILACQLPPHISLKQPFFISNLPSLEEYMADFADKITPFAVRLTHLELVETQLEELQTGILWINAQESPELRALHDELNLDLTRHFGGASAPYDGPEYHFHMTVAIGGQPLSIYKKIIMEFSDRWRDLDFRVNELVLFVYDDSDVTNPGYMTYKILSLKL